MLALVITVSGLVLAGADPQGRIAYLSSDDSSPTGLTLKAVDLASGMEVNFGPASPDGPPAWSPDGLWVAYSAPTETGGSLITVKRVDGAETREAKTRYARNRWPRWSPDGRRIAFSSDDGVLLDARISVYDALNNSVAEWGGEQAGLWRPVWLAGIKWIYTLNQISADVFGESAMEPLMMDMQLNGALLAIGVTGEGERTTDLALVASTGAVPLLPAALSHGKYFEWAIEGNRTGDGIAFESNDGGDREIFVLSKLGMTDVTNHREADWNPVWSPDGHWIAFESFRGGRRGIYRVFPATGRVFTVVAQPDADAWHPTWSPDGKWMAFVSDLTGDSEIYLVHVDGTGARPLTKHPGPDLAPAWAPEKSR